MQKSRQIKKRDYLLRIHGVSAIINVAIIFALCLTIIGYSYNGRKNNILSENYLVANEINQYFDYKFGDLWKLYRPFFSAENQEKGVLEAYQDFATSVGPIQPFVRSKLVSSIRNIVALDSDISSIALYRSIEPDKLYMFYVEADVLQEVSGQYANGAEQSILESVQKEHAIRILRGGYFDEKNEEYCYLIGGSLPNGLGGSLLVSYSTLSMKNLYRRSQQDIKPRVLILAQTGEVIFDSEETLYGKIVEHPQQQVLFDSCEYEVQKVEGERNLYSTYALTAVDELHSYALKDMPVVLLVCLLLACVSVGLYVMTWLQSAQRVRKINDGIRMIGSPQLDFRFDFSENQREDEFTSIEKAINSMTEDIQRYIEAFKKASKQRIQAEMNELQAKSNPHFLYNTLETLRTKLEEAGNDESSDLLRMLAYVLQNYVKGKRFVTINEEIALLNIYIDFYRLRYEDAFSVNFDIAPEIASYGIIRNILQPVVENYFVHGFDRERMDNQLTITGDMDQEGFIVITLENNGNMIPADRLIEIRSQLEMENEEAGFGLRNVSTRLKLFYGKESYLKIDSAPEYTRTRIVLRPMTLEEHEQIMDELIYDEYDRVKRN